MNCVLLDEFALLDGALLDGAKPCTALLWHSRRLSSGIASPFNGRQDDTKSSSAISPKSESRLSFRCPKADRYPGEL